MAKAGECVLDVSVERDQALENIWYGIKNPTLSDLVGGIQSTSQNQVPENQVLQFEKN